MKFTFKLHPVKLYLLRSDCGRLDNQTDDKMDPRSGRMKKGGPVPWAIHLFEDSGDI